jgi:hypothetical protein
MILSNFLLHVSPGIVNTSFGAQSLITRKCMLDSSSPTVSKGEKNTSDDEAESAYADTDTNADPGAAAETR